MRFWERWLLGSYLRGTMPYRAWVNARARRDGRSPVVVLFYHRVADTHPNPWTISRAGFVQHLDWLAPRFDFVSLDEAQRRMAGPNHRPAVSITFDDGYADNCQWAMPTLIERQIPCAYFVTTHHALTGEPFAHDVACGCPLQPNSVTELRELAAAGIEIGGHTETHADLGSIGDGRQLFEEIVGAARRLERAIDSPIRYFAFPFGLRQNLSRAAFAIARGHGFAGVCSAYGGYNFPGDDPFHLQRIHGDPELLRLKNWLTVDPRKAGRSRFDDRAEPRPPVDDRRPRFVSE